MHCAGIEPELADEDDDPPSAVEAAAAAGTAADSAADPVANGDAASNEEHVVAAAAAPAAAVAKPAAASTAAAKRTRRVKPKAAGPQLDVLLVATGTGASEKARHCVAATLVDQWNVEAWNILITEAQQGRYVCYLILTALACLLFLRLLRKHTRQALLAPLCTY